ncbi:hypothetical protein O181_014151, partial [Austropuccinia psidii MF-1]|nr:hypothetical protein [Austropuccinia psidii MF-1]
MFSKKATLQSSAFALALCFNLFSPSKQDFQCNVGYTNSVENGKIKPKSSAICYSSGSNVNVTYDCVLNSCTQLVPDPSCRVELPPGTSVTSRVLESYKISDTDPNSFDITEIITLTAGAEHQTMPAGYSCPRLKTTPI